MIATIKKWGNSQGVRISKEMLAGLGIKVDDKVEIKQNDDKITITPVRDNKLKMLLSEWKGTYDEKEIDWGEPQGREIW